jgi:hypothetical protein
MNGTSRSNESVPGQPDGRGDYWSRLALIAANLLPLAGVVLMDWDLLSVLLLYWLEAIVICSLAVLRALYHSGWSALGVVLVFVLAFVTLSAGHLAVLVVLAEALGQAGSSMPDLSAAADVSLFSALRILYLGGLEWIADERSGLLFYALPALALSQMIGCWPGPRITADRRLDSAQTILRQALERVIVLHLALLGGSAVVAALQAGDLLPVLALLILFKLVFDLRDHRQAERVARPAV